MLDAARRLSVRLNLFYNFRTDFRHFTDLEVFHTYLFLGSFVAAAVLFALRFFQSTHLAWHCQLDPELDDICPTAFSLCVCPDQPLVADVCNLERVAVFGRGCTCCAYGQLDLQTGVPLFLTHVGGLWTLMLGASIAFLAAARRRIEPAPPVVTVEMCRIETV